MTTNLHQHGLSRNTRFALPEQILMDRRPVLLQYAAHLRAKGRTFKQIHDAVLTVNNERCCPPLTDKRALHDLKRIAKWAANKPAGVSQHGTISTPEKEAIEEALAFLDAFQWRGIASNNARIVAYALLKKMHELGRVAEVGAACRDLAEVVGLSFPATAAALRRLCGIGKDKREDVPVLFLRTEQKGIAQDKSQLSVKSLSYEYSLNQSAISIHTISHAPIPYRVFKLHSMFSTLSHDAFRVRGVGLKRSAALVLAALPCATARAIAAATHLSKRTVRNALAALKAEGLIEKKKESACWMRTCETLDAVAERRGTAGAGERQKRMHALQREAYGARLVKPTGRKDSTVYTLRPPKEEEQRPPDPTWGEYPDDWYRDAA
jgi:hypothetical protein